MGARVTTALLISILFTALGASSASAGELALKRVMLSTGGVAYLEYEAEVNGDEKLSLDVPLDQVDDILKSIVVYDSKGGVGSATLPGREPLTQTFSELPFDQGALTSPAALLTALQGAEIRVGSAHPVTGRVLSVVPETVRLGNDATTTRNRVTLLTADGLQQFILEEAESVHFTDPALETQVESALASLAAHRTKDRRRIDLVTKGTGARTVRIGYVVAAPLWKATFRLSLPSDPAAQAAHLQGWAVLENMSGEDWKGVELTLVSGNPVSFRQAIYQAYYVARPEVPVEVAGRILPRPDTGVMSDLDRERTGGSAAVPGGSAFRASLAAPASAAEAAKSEPAAVLPAPPPAALTDAATAEEGFTQVTFRVPVPVSLESGHSSLVALVDRDVPVIRLDLVPADLTGNHPLASIRLTNDTGVSLPPGVVTLYEADTQGATYLGDARLAGLPARENRLLSYAVDDKTKIARDMENTSAIVKGSISQGVLHLTSTWRRTVTYRVSAPAGEARRLLIEQAMLPGWQLTEPKDRVEQTANAYRVALDLKPGETGSFAFVLEQPRFEELRITDLGQDRIAAVVASSAVDPAIKNAFTEIARLRQQAAAAKTAADRIKGEISDLTQDQQRIRANLESADRESALHKRYMAKLDEEETRLETLQADSAKANQDAAAKADLVTSYIFSLKI
ncbi:MAG TPA: DUF4139 domain-containing protein [Stellaceae bacterium]|nr:DUF4139 domain-containing protein [Stellaceae bacterium]